MSERARSLSIVGGLIAFIGFVTLATDASAGGLPGLQDRAADSTAVEAFWSKLDSVWNARDAQRLSELFTDDASFALVERGQSFETRSAIHRRFVQQFRIQSPELRHTTRLRRFHRVAPDIVVIDGIVEVSSADAESAALTVVRHFAITAVMVQDSQAWRIRLVRAYQLPPTEP